ncbi:alpha/beta fold hydrolase [Spirulina sp. CS-785/01]|uniref:alpha/beta hydrolase n=1 Tax=Spirulina sp. CS-785/01 TaxID=3021716 RepID=UPI00232D2CB6|nr:alpha/beta fold hydrolase [Spirulina sp. CS-785/01]MDB9312811.1 alpha/beta fold hydrolase [Spirulina sp. CS-785/01]
MIRQRPLSQNLGFWLGLVLLSFGLMFHWVSRPHLPHSEIIQVSRTAEKTLMGRLYVPVATETPYPTIMLWHGVSSTKETLTPLALELARHGVAVLTFDAGGFGESYARPFDDGENLVDGRLVARYVYEHPERFDGEKVGVGGHSMGGAMAILLANEDDRIKLAIALGMTADINRIIPPNLLMGIGVYDQLHPPQALRSMLQQGTGQPPQSLQQYGTFEQGNARQLVISPTSDHLIEPFDPTLVQATVRWVQEGFKLQTPSQGLILPQFMVSPVLILLGSLLSVSYGVRGNRTLCKHRRWVGMSLVLLTLLVLGLGMRGYIPPIFTTDLILLLAIAIPITDYALTSPKQLTAFWRITGLYAIVLLLAYSLAALLPQIPELIAHPSVLLHFPQFLSQLPIALFYSRMQEVRALFFSLYSEVVIPRWTLFVVLLPEFIKPGILLRSLTQGAIWVARWLRQPLHFQWHECPSRRSLALLGGLVIVLGIVLYPQVQGGLFTLETLGPAVTILLQMGLLPGVLVVGMLRSRLLQNLETRLQR